MKNLSSYLSEGFFNNIGNNKDVAIKKAIQNFDILIKDCVELLKDIASNTKDKDRSDNFSYTYYTHIKQQFGDSKQYEKLKDVFNFLMENHEYNIIVSTKPGGKRDIMPGEFEAFREYGVNLYDDILEIPTTVTYRDPSRAAAGFFPVLYAYALDINTKDIGLSTGNFKIQDIYLVKC